MDYNSNSEENIIKLKEDETLENLTRRFYWKLMKFNSQYTTTVTKNKNIVKIIKQANIEYAYKVIKKLSYILKGDFLFKK